MVGRTLAGNQHYVDFTNDYTPAHQIASSALSNAAFQYMPSMSGADSYAANGLNQYSVVTPAGGSATNIGYDLNGNLTSDGSFAFGYDPENRLMKADKTDTSVAYAYDPLGRRTTKTVSGGTYAGTMYFLDSGDDPASPGGSAAASEIAEYDASGNLLRRYVPGPGIDQPIAMVTASGTKTFFHQDKTGSVIAMSDASGAIAEGPYTYDPFSNSAPPTGVPYKYTGRRLDPETGLYFLRARYYSSLLGRFLQTDPVGYKDDINWYAYVQNDPTDKTDPTGLMDDFTASQYGDAVMKMTPQERGQMAAIGGGAIVAGGAIAACVAGGCEAAALAAGARLGVASPGAAAALPAIGNALTEGNPTSVAQAGERAAQIANTMGKTKSFVTIGVTDTAEGARIISSSENALRPPALEVLLHGEIPVTGAGHAEITGVNAAKNLGLTPTGTATSRPICPECARFLKDQGVQPLSKLKK